MQWINQAPPWFRKHVSKTWNPPIFQRLIQIKANNRSDSPRPIRIIDSELRALGKQELLTVLSVTNSPITDVGIQHFGPMPFLFQINLPGTSISELNWIDPVQMTSLRYVDLGGTPLNDKGFNQLAKLTRVERLDLNKTRITNSGLRSLSQNKSVRELTLSETEITDEDLRTVSQMLQLQTLRLCKTRITGSGLRYLKPLTNLDEIDLSDSGFQDQETLNFEGMKGLRTLKLSGTALTNQGLAKLTLIPSLQRLYLQQTQATIAGLKPLKNLADISHLTISNPEPLTDADVQTLKTFYYLETLSIYDTSVTPEIIESLASLPYMAHLTFRHSQQRIAQKDLEVIQTRHPKVEIRLMDH